ILMRDAGLTAQQLDKALAKQRAEGGLLGEILRRMGVIDEKQLLRALATQFELPFADKLPKAEEIDGELIANLPIGFARRPFVVPIGRDAIPGRVPVVLADPLAPDVRDDIGVLIGAPMEGALAVPLQITELINKVYGRLRQGADLAEDKENDDEFGDAEEL